MGLLIYKNGINIKKSGFWLDAGSPKDISYVSHAHSDHMKKHKCIFSSDKTKKFIEYFYPKSNGNIVGLPFNERVAKNGLFITLFPAGHILGSSQILIEGERRIVYTGDFKLSKGETSEEIEFKKAHVLIMESTFGFPRYQFPEREEVTNKIIGFVEDAFDMKLTPVFFAYSLGKSQELIKILGDRGFRLRVHPTIFNIAKIYEALEISLKNYRPFPPYSPHREVIIYPPYLKNSLQIRSIKKKRTAIVTGWAVDKETKEKFGVDEAIPLSDHADFQELLTYVDTIEPEKVYTIHGAKEFAEILKKRGHNAFSLNGDDSPPFWEEGL